MSQLSRLKKKISNRKKTIEFMSKKRTDFDLQNHLANELLQHHGAFAIHKVARAGCSLSLIKASCESGNKTTIFSSTTRILRQIEEEIPKITSPSPRIAPILSNPELCTKIQPNPKLKFQFKHSCRNCEYRGKPQQCVFQDLMMNEFDVYCLTYSKLQALQKSTSEDARLLPDKLQKRDVFIFDEFTSALVTGVPTIEMISIDEKVTSNAWAKISGLLSKRSLSDQIR